VDFEMRAVVGIGRAGNDRALGRREYQPCLVDQQDLHRHIGQRLRAARPGGQVEMCRVLLIRVAHVEQRLIDRLDRPDDMLLERAGEVVGIVRGDVHRLLPLRRQRVQRCRPHDGQATDAENHTAIVPDPAYGRR
jgi:hypothetical protein